MKRRQVYTVVAVLVATGLLAAFLVSGLFFPPRLEETTSLLSPDKRLRAVLLDPRYLFQIDRNFRVRIEVAGGVPRTVFTSPDEPRTGIGSEHFLWSADGKRVLLVGKRFWVREGVQLESGELLYLLYDVPSGQVWCNSDSQGPPFGPNELAGYDFGESLALKPAPKG